MRLLSSVGWRAPRRQVGVFEAVGEKARIDHGRRIAVVAGDRVERVAGDVRLCRVHHQRWQAVGATADRVLQPTAVRNRYCFAEVTAAAAGHAAGAIETVALPGRGIELCRQNVLNQHVDGVIGAEVANHHFVADVAVGDALVAAGFLDGDIGVGLGAG